MVDGELSIATAEAVTTCPGRNYTLVRLETEDGLVGYGDATLNGREKAVEATLEHHVFPDLLGHDAARVEDVWQMLFRQTYWRGGPVLNSALSGVDMALWDLKGKRAGMPLYDLLGGRTREYATVYQHCDDGTPEEIVANIERESERGIQHFRVNIWGVNQQYTDPQTLVESTRRVRESVGPDPDLVVDIHGLADPIEAADLARRLEPYDLFFLEDPVRPEYPDAFETVRRHSTTPLAMGELFANPWEMLPLIENDLVDYLRTALIHVGGVTAAKKLAAVGEHHYVRTAFQGPIDISPVGYAATVHLDLCVPNFGIQECTEHEEEVGPEIEELFTGGAQFVDGAGGMDVPADPGLGIEVDWNAALEYAHERQHMGHPRDDDGSVLDI